jgi:RNase H-fold protein (predicted Holliday junction resolvase)
MNDKEKLNKMRAELLCLHNKMSRARRLYQSYNERWMQLKVKCEKLDYEIALQDQRFKKVTAVREVKMPQLTPKQAKQLIDALNESGPGRLELAVNTQ